MAGLGSPDLDIGESVRISIFNSPFSDSVKLDFKEMLTTTNNIYTIYCTFLTYRVAGLSCPDVALSK